MKWKIRKVQIVPSSDTHDPDKWPFAEPYHAWAAMKGDRIHAPFHSFDDARQFVSWAVSSHR